MTNNANATIPTNENWIPFNRGVEVNVCVIIKRRKGLVTKWDIQEIESFKGDWHDLIFTLYTDYGQFRNEVEHLSKEVAKHNKLDEIALKYIKLDMPYEFVLADGTDDWYLAYVKPVVFKMDPDGSLR